MPVKILMPALSPTMTEGNLAKWLKKEGDKVEPGQVLAEIETDKAIMEVEAVDQGILAKILIPSGSSGVKVNQVIAILREEGDDDETIAKTVTEADEFEIKSNEQAKQEEPTDTTNLTHTQAEESQTAILPKTSTRIFASPLAKRLAKDHSIDLTKLQGSGPRGRIVKNDVLAAKNSRPISKNQDEVIAVTNTASSTLLPISTMRKVIAQRLVQSKQEVPHFYLNINCEVSELLDLRKQINNIGNQYKISVNDMIVKAAAMAMMEVPETNASWNEQGILSHNSIDISIAVALDEGLITPIIKNVATKSLAAISNEIKQLVDKAKEGKLKPEEFQGGSFTISNLGMYGMESFAAIINPPQSFILAIGAALEKPVIKDNKITVGKTITITMSCDHRVIDGAVGARYCAALQKYLTNPMMILV